MQPMRKEIHPQGTCTLCYEAVLVTHLAAKSTTSSKVTATATDLLAMWSVSSERLDTLPSASH